MNNSFTLFRQLLLHPVRFRIFLLRHLPVAFFAGVRVVSLSPAQAVLQVRQRWFNKNPFRSIYFGMLAMTAEISTGVLCMGMLYRQQPGASMLIVQHEGRFYKKATGTILFTCTDGVAIQETIAACLAGGGNKTLTCRSTGTNSAGDTVAEFVFTWSFKAKVHSLQG